MLPAKKLCNYSLPLGQSIATGKQLDLNGKWLETSIHVVGPPGVGKSMLLFWLFQLCTKIRNATIVLLDPKGDLYFLARDWAIAYGLTGRLDLFDLSDSYGFMHYSNLTPNGLDVASHTKFAREGFRSAWGAHSFDETPQLARLLYLSLFVTRSLGWTLLQAVQLLWPGSPTRKQALRELPPSYVRDALTYFDSLSERRQEELAASTLARLEPFVSDPRIERVICPPNGHSFGVDNLIKRHGILLANFQHYAPLLPDDAKLLARFLLNDVLAHGFSRPKHARDPIIIIGDEVQEFATRDLCAALDRGRGLRVFSILAHQHVSQVQEEDKTGYLFSSLQNCARTKIVFGGNSVVDLEQHFVKELFLDQYDPWTIKQELASLELDPVEETRTSITEARSRSRGRGLAFPFSVSDGESTTVTDGLTESESEGTQDSVSHAVTRGSTRGISRDRGTSETRTDSWAEMDGESASWAETDAEAENWSETEGDGETSSEMATTSVAAGANGSTDFGLSIGGDGDLTRSYHQNSGWNTQTGSSGGSGHSSSHSQYRSAGGSRTHATTRGGSTMHATTKGDSVARGTSLSLGEQYSESDSETRGVSHSQNQEQGQAWTHSDSLTESKTVSRGRTPSLSEEESRSRSVSTLPFYAYRKRRNVTSREFLSKDDFLTLALQRLRGQGTGHFVVKVPGKPAVFARAPFIKEPRITTQQLARARERIFAQPYYTRIGDDERTMPPALIEQQPVVPNAGGNDTPSPASTVLQLEDKSNATNRTDNQPTVPESGSTIESRRAQLPLRAPRGKNNSPRRTRSKDS